MKKLFSILFILCITCIYAQVDRTVMPQSGSAPEIKLGTPQEFTLPNGLKVLVVEDHKLPRISISLQMDNPPILEGNKAGVSSLTSSLLGQGSVNIPKEEFYEEVDFMGARINLGTYGGFASGLSKYTDRILELMSEAALKPDFREEYLQDEKKKLTESLKNNEKNVSSIAGRLSRALGYGKKHPSGEFITPETIAQVSLNDVKSFYSNQFVPANAHLIMVGDVKLEEAKEMVSNHFSSWTKAGPPNISYTHPRDVQYLQINFTDMPNAVQSEIRVQNLVDFKLGDENYFPALLANYILGGGGDGRLFQVLREEYGFTYGAYSGASPNKYRPTLFTAYASVRNEVTDSAVVAFLETIDEFINNPVTDTELANAKAKYSGNFVMSLEDPETMAELELNIRENNLPKDFYANYLEEVNKVTKEDIQRVAREFIKPEQMRIIVAGKGSEVSEKLENINFKGRKIPVRYYTKEAELTEKPDYTASIPEGMTAESVLESYIKAIGGAQKLQEVNSVWITAEAQVQGMTLGMEMKKNNAKYLVDMTMQGNSISKQIYDGQNAFMIAQGQKQELPEDMKKAMARQAQVFPELQWVKNGNTSLERIESVDGAKAYVLKTGDNEYNFYDMESGLKIRNESSSNIGGNTVQQTQNLDDYREVNGIKFPFAISQNVGPQSIVVEITDIRLNEGVESDDFQ